MKPSAIGAGAPSSGLESKSFEIPEELNLKLIDNRILDHIQTLT